MANEIEVDLVVKIEKAAKDIEKFSKDAESRLGVMGAAAASFIGNFASDVAQKALSSIVGLLKESVDEALEAERATSQLANAFRVTGVTGRGAVDSLKKFADEMARTTTLQDDAIVSAAALLQTMASLDTNGLKRATKAAIELSAAFKIDLDTAVRMVGKAAEGNISSFQRYGIEIKKGNTDAETFSNTLKRLEDFNGSAAAETETYTGKLLLFNNKINELKESVGTSLLPTLTEGLGILNKWVDSLGTFIDKQQQARIEMATGGKAIGEPGEGVLTGSQPLEQIQFNADGEVEIINFVKDTYLTNDQLKIESDDNYTANKKANVDAISKAEQDQIKMNQSLWTQYGNFIRDTDRQANINKVAAAQQTFATIATLMSSHNEKLFRIGQAGSIANATMNTAEGFTKALAAFPPPINFILAGIVAAAGVAQIGTIAAQKPPSTAKDGIDFIPDDKMTWVASRGERVVGSRLNEDLMNFLDKQDTAQQPQVSNVISINVNGVIGDFGDDSRKMLADSVISALEYQNVSRRGVI